MASGVMGAAGRPPPSNGQFESTLPSPSLPALPLASPVPPESRAARLSRSLRRATPVTLAAAAGSVGLAYVGRHRRAERRRNAELLALRVASSAEASSSRRLRSESRRTDPSDAGARHLTSPRRKAGKQQAPQPAPKEQEPQPQPAAQPPRALYETFVDLMCGAVAEATQLALLYPLDTLKVRCQLSRRRPGAELRALLASGGGLRALYAGVAPAALGASLFGGAYMLAYQAFYRRNVRLLTRGAAPSGDDGESLPLPTLAAAAGGAAVLANCCTALLEVPLDTARQRLQAGVAAGPLTRVIAASARAGPRVLYAGFVPFLLRTIPLDALQFFVYAGLQSARERADAAVEDRPPPAAQSAVQVWLADAGLDMILGGIAGGVSAFATMPLDCIKTHINCQTGGGPTGVIPVTKAIWKASGPRGFFAGTSSRLAERVPSCAVYWLAAEATRRVLSPEDRTVGGAEALAA